MRSLLFYDNSNPVFSELLKKLKYSTDRGAEKLFARELSREMLLILTENGELPGDWCVTYPPRRRSAVLKYGFDQSKGMAKRIAKYTGVRFESVFTRKGKVAQKTLGAAERQANAKDAFGLGSGADVAGKKYFVIDDVVTSGATTKACQRLILSSGGEAAYVLSVSKTPLRGAGHDEKIYYRKKPSKTWFNEK